MNATQHSAFMDQATNVRFRCPRQRQRRTRRHQGHQRANKSCNLGRNIFLLRKALGEGPQDHRYILTVPGCGYWFSEDVRVVPEQELKIVAASHSKVQVQVKETKAWRGLSVAVVLLLAIAAGATWLSLHPKPVLTAKDTVVITDFTNTTGDPVFDGTLRQGLSVQLEQSPFLSLVSDEHIQQTLRLMGNRATGALRRRSLATFASGRRVPWSSAVRLRTLGPSTSLASRR